MFTLDRPELKTFLRLLQKTGENTDKDTFSLRNSRDVEFPSKYTSPLRKLRVKYPLL